MKRRKNKKPGRADVRTLVVLLLIILVVVSLPFALHQMSPARELAITIYDKTVPTKAAEQHRSLLWFMQHYKYPTPDGSLFGKTGSHLGYNPEDAEPIKDLTFMDPRTDVLYVADTYGVYRNAEGFSRTTVPTGESNLIWGGTTESDVQLIRQFLNRKKSSTVIAEYNTFATPTPSYVQAQMYQVLGTRWTGWTGMYVHDLSPKGEVPAWILEQFGGSWNYQGKGIILSNIHDEVVVLREGVELGPKALQFQFTEAGTTHLGLSGSQPYSQLFDITESLAGTEALATYELDTTAAGAALLASYGVPSSFPAVQLKQTAHHLSYYFSGNWAFSREQLRFSRAMGMHTLMQRVSAGERAFLWKVYLPLLKAILDEAQQRKSFVTPQEESKPYLHEGVELVARTRGQEIQVYQDGTWQPLFIYGMNLGTAMPGKWFTEFPQDKSLYYRWLKQMGELGINTLRIYTLLDSEFYQAFSLYNRLHPEKRLYLLQEVWPEEEPPGHDYLRPAYQQAFEEEIRNVVDAVHGNATIDERRGRAWGSYTANVSPYLIGYLVGRELEPHEVEETDLQHEGYRFIGQYLSTTKNAAPTESWLAQSCDYLLSYEEKTYNRQTPVSIVNWPTLDYLEHDSERDEEGKKIREYNDRTTVDINHLVLGEKNKAGLFGSYHIYPNYPDFMNNEPSFDLYTDEEGRLRYGGYLKEFMDGHKAYPAVVAEFGIATGMGNAHTSPDGYHHGGLDEKTQAQGIIRMFEAMKREGYSGGIIFEWMDEWAKKTWTTEPFMVPYDRQILWHNSIDPEQNYGILAYVAVKPARSSATYSSDSFIQRVEIRSDVSFLTLDILLSRPLNFGAEQLLVGIDTLYRNRGEQKYLPELEHLSESGMEYLVVLDGFDSSRLLAIAEADYTRLGFSTATALKQDAAFLPMEKLINKQRSLTDGTPIPAKYEDASHLRYGTLVGSTNHWTMDGNHIEIRIPWTRINVSDPSSAQVLDDERTFYTDPLRDVIATSATDALVLSVVATNKAGSTVLDATSSISYVLPTWNQPVYQERLKASYPLLAAYFSEEHAHD